MSVSSSTDGHPAQPVAVPLLDVEPQNHPLNEEITESIRRVCQSGLFIHGPECREFERAVAEYCGTSHAVGCASGSDALLLSLMALGIGKDDEVILPSFTFFATAGAVWRVGALPVFVDIDPESFNIDPAAVEKAIRPATKAILPVHLFGRCAEMTALNAIAQQHGLHVIEDAAQSIGAEHCGQRAGSLGTLGCFSFYPTKNLGAFGDGGMITTHDADMAHTVRALRDHGQSPRYYHHAVGINSRLDSIQAAVLNVKLDHLEHWSQQRQENAARYAAMFADANADLIVAPRTPSGDRAVWNQYTIRVRNGHRDALAAHLKQHNIGTAIYYPLPLHRQPCFARLGYDEGRLPHTEQAAREVLSLPIYPGLTILQQRTVVQQIEAYVRSTAAVTSVPLTPHALGRNAAAST